MATPHRLSRTLQNSLGAEDADIMVDWMNQPDALHASTRLEMAERHHEGRGDIAALRQEMRSEFADVRAEMRAEFADVRAEMRAEFADVRGEMRSEFADIRTEIRVGFADMTKTIDIGLARIETSFAKSHADFMKWTLGFWVISLATVVGAVIALSRPAH